MIKTKGNVIKELAPTFHKYGADFTWSQCTDTFKPDLHAADVEMQAFKNNLQVTALVAPLTDGLYESEMKGAYQSGRIDFGMYFLTWAWENPKTKKLEALPSWIGTTFTQQEADLGIITQDKVGISRQASYYTINDPLYELSNGKYGYDDINHKMGAIDVVSGSVKQQFDWFKSVFGKYPSYSSYSYGRHILDDLLLPRLTGTRGNTIYDDTSNYQFNRQNGIDRMVSSVYNYNVRDKGMSVALENSKNNLNKAITNNGWFNDFSHWHWASSYGDKNQWSQFFEQQRTLIGDKKVASLGIDKAFEYQYLRNMVKDVHLLEQNSKYYIQVETKDEYQPELPKLSINTRLSVRLDLTGTPLENKDITGSSDIQKVDDNQFIIEVPYSNSNGFSIVEIKPTTQSNYMNFSLPKIIASNLSGMTLSVQTDQPTNLVVFICDSGAETYTAQIGGRSNSMNTSHAITLKDISNKDIYIGAITKVKQSILQKV
ncbi:hypothetical protein [Staphylococcus haemolyticus]|uniref:hypothetical protein n=1 Tax=Staphylococcus haemolyticus TaxID=1283 RepID=UPI000BA692E5|nr:hypothetical protein [Staphylococcus haemolyticus]PAK69411.1 hypothetical protein B8W97_10080 [Staphylococcus haemolyticus]